MHGETLSALCRSAVNRVCLVAPFMKAPVIERVLAQVGADVPLDCVTRWRPQEIVSGASDLEVWHSFRSARNRRLFLRQDLHAKFYRADERCMVGSANLTATALGYVEPSNLELLLEVDASSSAIQCFESELWRAVVQVDGEIFDGMKELVSLLSPSVEMAPVPTPFGEVLDTPDRDLGLATWLPRTRYPEDLYCAYVGDSRELTLASVASTSADLAVLDLPAGLPSPQFVTAVRILMLQTPIVSAVDRFVRTERRFGEVARLLHDILGSGDRDDDWQTLIRWFRYFAPERYRYRRPGHSELISRI